MATEGNEQSILTEFALAQLRQDNDEIIEINEYAVDDIISAILGRLADDPQVREAARTILMIYKTDETHSSSNLMPSIEYNPDPASIMTAGKGKHTFNIRKIASTLLFYASMGLIAGTATALHDPVKPNETRQERIEKVQDEVIFDIAVAEPLGLIHAAWERKREEQPPKSE